MRSATAFAHPNIALSKYWGKRVGVGNFPAVPSLSVTLSELETRTTVTFDKGLVADRFVLNGVQQVGEPLARTTELLDRVRRATGSKERALVESRNNFPTASGLASSASGFAALALAAVQASGLSWSLGETSDLARRSSASAARSIYGGFVELKAGAVTPSESDVLSATPFAAATALDLRILIAVTTEAEKSVASRDGMRTTAEWSPYYKAWLEWAPEWHARVREAILTANFLKLGEAAESSAMAMHASAIAAGVTYWNGGTLEAIAAVKRLRRSATLAFATIDAGPHVKVLVSGDDDEARAKVALEAVPGVLRVMSARVGGPAEIVHEGSP